MEAVAKERIPRYLGIARGIEKQIREGTLKVGERVASLRDLRRREKVSVSTAIQAYLHLERVGLLEARPRSGFFVRIPHAEMAPEPRAGRPPCRPTPVGLGAIVQESVAAASDPGMVPLGAACPGPSLLPNRSLNRIVRSILRENPLHSARYAHPAGLPELRRQIARRSPELGCNLSPEEILVTRGAMDALGVCLRAVARPGDVVAVESPTYYGFLQALETLGMRALEIPTHPRGGMDLDRLEQAIRRHRVRACFAMPSVQNPLGYVLPEAWKRDLAELLMRHEVPLLEDDVYGDLAYAEARPRTVKSFDRKELVLLCGSFSKTLAPGYRSGWVSAGRFQRRVERIAAVMSVAAPSLPQMAVAAFLESGGYRRHLRRLRSLFEIQVHRVARAVARQFPEGTRVTRPAGGYLLWVEIPGRQDARELYGKALARGVSILPGTIFSPSARFRRAIRLSCGYPWSGTLEEGLRVLGELARGGISGAGRVRRAGA
jgi:DNA-binding transcriptional MocR family regulator